MKTILLFCIAIFLADFLALPALAFQDYYAISDIAKAQAEARQRHLPLAWLGSSPEALTVGSPQQGSIADLTQMALATLKDNAVIIFFDGRNMAPVPAFIHAQYHIQDDGPLPGGANWNSPKVVFCDPDMTKILGRVSQTEMSRERDAALRSALQIIKNDANSLTSAASQAAAVANKAAVPDKKSSPNTATNVLDIIGWIYDDGVYVLVAALVLVVGLFFALAPKRQ